MVLSDETRLILYALGAQAEFGQSAQRSKWGMSSTERAKYETWSNLGTMETFEAMRLFVKMLDDETPGWLAKLGNLDGDGDDHAWQRAFGQLKQVIAVKYRETACPICCLFFPLRPVLLFDLFS